MGWARFSRRFSPLAVVLAPAAIAHAEPREGRLDTREPNPGMATTAPEPRYALGPSYWYGWQVLIADGVGLTLFLTADGERPGQLWAALGTYALGGPIVHASHGQGLRALGSLGLRVAGAVGGAAAFVSEGCHDYRDEQGHEQTSCAEAVGLGVSVLLLAGTVDAVFADAEPRIPVHQPPSLGLAPVPGGAVGFFGGRF